MGRQHMKRSICLTVVVAIVLFCCTAESDELADRAERAMKRATEYFRSISTNGGYAGIYSLDLQQRYGEAVYEKAALGEIWVQPPGTPSVGRCFLTAYQLTKDSDYLNGAREAGRALAWGQRQEGGWDHRVDVTHMKAGSDRVERLSGRCALDDNITQGALTYLIDLDDVIDESWLSESIRIGLDFMIESQFSNGAWPQWYPLIGGYHDYYTFNDNTINDCIILMLKAHRTYGDKRYLESAEKGGDFIIISQLPSPQTGWAQQYSHDMKPAWARAFEPPAVCSAVTSRNIRTLVDLYHYTGDERYLEPIPSAITWLEKSKLDDNLWARMYEVGTNVPIYGDRDSKVHYTLEEISEERRRGYSWQSSFGVESAIRMYQDARTSGPKGNDARDTDFSPARKRERAKTLAPDVRAVIESLDDKGRWVNAEDSMIYSRDFVRNFTILCSYLEAVGD